jgi:hypothetical protein
MADNVAIPKEIIDINKEVMIAAYVILIKGLRYQGQ